MIDGAKPRSREIPAALHSIQISGLLEEKKSLILFLIVVADSENRRGVH